jgi:hypothetical protein
VRAARNDYPALLRSIIFYESLPSTRLKTEQFATSSHLAMKMKDNADARREQAVSASLDAEEKAARTSAARNSVYLLFVNTYSAIVVFVVHLISLESWISIALSVSMTLYT